jgi:hypothetical protein
VRRCSSPRSGGRRFPPEKGAGRSHNGRPAPPPVGGLPGWRVWILVPPSEALHPASGRHTGDDSASPAFSHPDCHRRLPLAWPKASRGICCHPDRPAGNPGRSWARPAGCQRAPAMDPTTGRGFHPAPKAAPILARAAGEVAPGDLSPPRAPREPEARPRRRGGPPCPFAPRGDRDRGGQSGRRPLWLGRWVGAAGGRQ